MFCVPLVHSSYLAALDVLRCERLRGEGGADQTVDQVTVPQCVVAMANDHIAGRRCLDREHVLGCKGVAG